MQAQNHVLDAPVGDSNFAGTVNVSGKSNYGAPLLKPLAYNGWMNNIAQEYAIITFNYSDTNAVGDILFSDSVHPFYGTTTGNIMPWFLWFLTNYQSFECQFDLVFKPVKHSSHRGVFSVASTLFGSSSTNLEQGFLPLKHFDISGENSDEYVYPIPQVYAFSAKTFYEYGRNLSSVSAAATTPFYATYLANVNVRVSTPLVSSSMLPSQISVIMCLRPNISTLKVSNPVLASSVRTIATQRLTNWSHD